MTISDDQASQVASSHQISQDRLFVHVVTFNNEATIAKCIESVLGQVGFLCPITLLVTDNASTDRTREIFSNFSDQRIRLTFNDLNLGFCQANNVGFSEALAANFDFVFILNPDAMLLPDTLVTLVLRLKRDSLAGFASPKLLRVTSEPSLFSTQTFDSAGMIITRSLRHFDRGSNVPDTGQYEREEYVFGATGAACLFKREFLLDVSLNPVHKDHLTPIEVFDSAFFAYREDADLAFRAAWLGWRCLYVPKAIVHHVRKVLPENRASLPEAINAYSVRNRFLLQLNNYTPLVSLRSYPHLKFRNLVVCSAVYLKERSSLHALRSVKFLKRRAQAHLLQLKRRRRVTWSYLSEFFIADSNSKHQTLPRLPLTQSGTHTQTRDVIAVIINFNSGKRLLDCMNALVKDIDKLSKTKVRILAWDNASEDQSFESAQSELKNHPSCIFRKSKKNLGFAGAINAAYSEYSADAILILNPDVYISAIEVAKLASTLDLYPQLGVIAPILMNEDSTPQIGFSVRGLPTTGSLVCDLLGLKHIWPTNPWSEGYYQTGNQILTSYLKRKVNKLIPHLPLNEPLAVEQPAGAALLVRKAAFDSVGGFDTCFHPAWFEDVDFCKRILQEGWQIAVLGDSQAIHEGGYSVQNLGTDTFAEAWYSNLRRYVRKHFQPTDRIFIGTAITFALLLRSIHAPFSKKINRFRDRLKVSRKLITLIGKITA